MFKKAITFEDFNGNEVTKEYYFNLSKVELLDMEKSVSGGYGEMLKKMVNANDKYAMIDVVETIVLNAYGEKSEDGLRFVKNDKIREEFKQTPAYSELVYEILTDEQASNAFITGIMPQSLVAQMAANNPSLPIPAQD